MLFMLTPEIKTNLILKEIGIKRYSLRSKMPHSIEKGLHYYQKGLILALLDKPFEDFIKEQKDFIKAIIESTKFGDGKENNGTILFSSREELKEQTLNFSKSKLIIIFGNISNEMIFDTKFIKAPPIDQLISSKELKKDLWIEIKNKLNL